MIAAKAAGPPSIRGLSLSLQKSEGEPIVLMDLVLEPLAQSRRDPALLMPKSGFGQLAEEVFGGA